MSAEWGSYKAWAEANLDIRGCLISPVRFLWKDYQAFCKEWGFEQAEVQDFVQWLRGEEGVKLREGGQGKLRRMIVGAGLHNNGVDLRDTGAA